MRTEHLEVRSSDSLLSHVRLAVVVGKHGHTIVDRNRLRRQLRELARVKLIPELKRMDIVLRANPSAYDTVFSVLAGEIDTIVSRLQASVKEA